jgi:hypothetical protein
MLEIWFSVGYVLLLAIVLFAWILRREGSAVLAVVVLLVGVPLWFGWEYVRPTWTTGTISGTEVRRTNPDRAGKTTDIEYIYMRSRTDRGLEFANEDSWWWFKRNSERVFNDAKTAQDRKTEVTIMWNRWRSTLFSWYPNAISFGTGDSHPAPTRGYGFYAISIVLWIAYFYAFIRLHNRNP